MLQLTHSIQTYDLSGNKLLIVVTEINGDVLHAETEFNHLVNGRWQEMSPPFPLSEKDVQCELDEFLKVERELEAEEHLYDYEEDAAMEATRDFERDQRL